MKTKNFFVIKLVAVTLMLGFFSPSITVEKSEAPKITASATKLDISEGLLAGLSTTDISFSLFTQAEARKHKRKKYNKKRRKARRKAHRRGNYRHHRRHNRRGGYYDRGRSNTGAVIGAAVVGAVVGAAINEANQD